MKSESCLLLHWCAFIYLILSSLLCLLSWDLCSIVATWRQGSCTNSSGVQKGMQMEILRSCLDKVWTEGITLAEQWSLLCYRLAADTSFLQ